MAQHGIPEWKSSDLSMCDRAVTWQKRQEKILRLPNGITEMGLVSAEAGVSKDLLTSHWAPSLRAPINTITPGINLLYMPLRGHKPHPNQSTQSASLRGYLPGPRAVTDCADLQVEETFFPSPKANAIVSTCLKTSTLPSLNS